MRVYRVVGRIVLAIALAIPLGLTAAPARAAPWDSIADTVFRHVALDDDMPNAALPMGFAEDGRGFVWIATQNGLARWDGYRFRAYGVTGDDTGPPEDVIHGLLSGPDGRVWIGTEAAGLAVHDPATGRFTRVDLHRPTAAMDIAALAADGDGGAWVGTADGIYHVDRGLRVVARAAHDPARADSLPAGPVAAILRDHLGTVWVGGRFGVARDPAADGRFQPVALPVPPGRSTDVGVILEDSGGTVWIGTREEGAVAIGPARDAPRSVRPEGAGPGPVGTVLGGAEVGPNHVWLATSDGIWDASSTPARAIRHDPAIRSSLSDNVVNAVARMRDGLVWVATNRGISTHDPGTAAIRSVLGGGGRGVLTGADVLSLAVLPDGKVWAGHTREGVDILDPATGRVGRLPLDGGTSETALGPRAVSAIAPLPNGSVLIGTLAGLYVADPGGRTVHRLAVPGRASDATSWCIAVPPPDPGRPAEASVWVGGPDGAWLLILGPAGARVARHEDASLTDPRIRAFDLDPDGSVWAGGIGLNRIAPGGVERLPVDPRDPAGIGSAHILSFARDAAGRLWIGTQDAGVAVMRTEGGTRRFSHVGVAEGMPNDDVSRLLPDAAGRIWASTDAGLAVIDPATLHARALGRPDGVVIHAYWSGSGVALPSGDLLFGGAGGITVVHPSLLAPPQAGAPIAVTDVRVGDAPPTAGTPPGALTVEPRANSLSVEFALLDYRAPELAHYAYRLDGFDRVWTHTDPQRRLASYTNLSPGQYRLRLAASGRDGTWHEAAPLPVTVRPAWFQTIWFRAAIGLLALGLFAGLLHARTRLLRRRQHALENLVLDRTAELRRSQEQLRQYAYHDLLTGLPNRRAFNEAFRRVLGQSQAAASRAALLLLDLDGFKHVNDTLGHAAGDDLLEIVAERLRGAVRETDFVGRLGGDEFVVILPDIDAATPICQRVLEALNADIALAGNTLRIGASMGVAVFPEDGARPECLYKSADLALYRAKRDGRGGAVWFETIGLPAPTDAD